MLALFALGLLIMMLLAPALAIYALSRVNRLAAEVAALRTQVSALKARLGPRAEREVPSVAPPAERAPTGLPSTPPSLPTGPPLAEAGPPVTPLPARPATLPDVTATQRLPGPTTSTSAAPTASIPRAAATPRPGTPPAPPPAPARARADFDVENLLGLRGAAWVGGIAIAIAGLLFAKLAIDRGLLTPTLRVVLLLMGGVGALLSAETSLRRGYATAANAVSGAGIALLYAAFFLAHSKHLIGALPAFACMALVTLVAGLVAVRFDAMVTALLGLLGGFATPVVLSTGQDRPVGLFSYILLLNIGLLAIALHKRWTSLAVLGLVGTFAIQLAWFGTHMTPAKMAIAVTTFLVFGVLYLLLPEAPGGRDSTTVVRTGALGGLLPFAFALLLAGQPRYGAEWPLLLGFVGLLDVALVVVALRRAQPALVVGAAMATALTLPIWAEHGLGQPALFLPALVAGLLVIWLNLPARLAPLLASRSRAATAPERLAWEAAGLVATAGLGLFALIAIARGFGEPPTLFLGLLTLLVGLLVERTGPARIPGAATLGALGLGALTQIWFFRATPVDGLLRNLAVPLLLALALSWLATLRSADPTHGAARAQLDDDLGVLAVLGSALLGLFAALFTPQLSSAAWPLFSALVVLVGLLLALALRRGWPWMTLPALAIGVAHLLGWQALRFRPDDVAVVVPFQLALYLVFLSLPFALGRVAARFGRSRATHAAAALAGPLVFLPLHDALSRALGKAWIGALPLALAFGALLALRAALQRFPARLDADPQRGPHRLDVLALYAAMALGLVALAVPLQLDRQWITVAWALEAAAVWWVFGRLPHRGLRMFGAVLFAAVGVRLLFNWDNLLVYQPRGWPIVNWLLYTYGVPALACLAGAAWLRRAEALHVARVSRSRLPGAASLLGLVLVFALVNLEIFDYFSAGRYVEFDWQRRYARDLAMSFGWGLYALSLLLIGVVRRGRALRLIGLAFLLLTVAKVFLVDLSSLVGVYRVLSFLGLGIALVLVSLLYQRFLAREDRA